METQLARGERSRGEWVAALRRRAEAGQESYRLAAVPAEQLWAVLENPEADPSARIGAALTLRIQTGPEPALRQRLAVASRATALPEVRSATEILAGEETEAVAVAKLTRTLR
ncbi:MAG: hypothetical protein EOP08_04245 [Proteobacteria bacterium]|nr:MAG: hypothetical protein EOP08_04245 [Pseudomonadota bacterium]